jgi:hypothetical protein
MNKIHWTKSSHQENFDLMIGELVQKKVSELLSEISEVQKKTAELSTTKDILTIKDVAKLLGMNERVVRDKINCGLIPAYKPEIGNRFYVLKSELIAEIQAGARYRSISNILAQTPFNPKIQQQ